MSLTRLVPVIVTDLEIGAIEVVPAIPGTDYLIPGGVDLSDLATTSGTPSASTYLRGDFTWAVPPGGNIPLGVILYDSNSVESLDAGNRLLITAEGVNSIQWNNFSMFDSGNNLSIQWSNGWLANQGITRLDWHAATLNDSLGDALTGLLAQDSNGWRAALSSDFTSHLVPVTAINATGTLDDTTYLRGDGTWSTPTGSGIGTVTSVSFTGDGTILSSTPSTPVTSDGTLIASLLTQDANKILAGPVSGGAANPTFRSLAASDIPSLSYQAPLTFTAPLVNTAETITIANATTDAFGVVKPDGTTITIADGIISSTATGGGTVTSVGIIVPSWLYVSGSPITTDGTISIAANISNPLPAYSGVNLTSLNPLNITWAYTSNLTAASIASASSISGSTLEVAAIQDQNSVTAIDTNSRFLSNASGTGLVGLIAQDSGGWRVATASDIPTLDYLTPTGNGSELTGLTKSQVGLANVENTALSTWAGSSDLTTLGTISSGTWNGTLVSPTYGGTGINNGAKTITLGGNFSTSGAFTTTLISTANTSVTLPVSGTLATTSQLTDGTVTSVSFPTYPSWLTASVATSTSTPAISLIATSGLTANEFLATPDGTTGSVGLRAIVSSDLPTASTSALGIVQPDGVSITISDGIISAVSGGGGSVTSFSAGTLSPIFTTSVATATSTPDLTFTLSNAAQNSFLAGPSTGGTGSPTYRAVAVADIPTLNQNTTGSAGSVVGLSVVSGKTLTVDNTLTLAGTDASTLNVGAGGTLGSAAFTSSTAYQAPLTFSTGLTNDSNVITVNTSQDIATLSNLTSNGFVTTSGGNGALSIDTNTYLTSVGAASIYMPISGGAFSGHISGPDWAIGFSGNGSATFDDAAFMTDGSGNVTLNSINKAQSFSLSSSGTDPVTTTLVLGDSTGTISNSSSMLTFWGNNESVASNFSFAFSGTDVVFENDGASGNIIFNLQAQFPAGINDAAYNYCIRTDTRLLQDINQITSLDWANRFLSDSSGTALSGVIVQDGSGWRNGVAGTDYAAPTSGSSILYGNGSGGFSNVTIGSGLTFADGTLSSSGSGGGTVTSFSAGDLSPLFTTSVATSTTTPALTFSLSEAAQNSFLAGPASGGTGAPVYRAIVTSDVPLLNQSTTGNAATVTGLVVSSGKTLTVDNSLTLSGTDGNTLNIGTGGTLGTAAYTAASTYQPLLTFSTGLTNASNVVTVNATQSISNLSNLTTNGFVKTSSSTGALSVDTNTYLTANQSITLTGDTTGSGTTSISTTTGKINGISLAGLSTGILKNTTSTGLPSIAVAGTDYPGFSSTNVFNGSNSFSSAVTLSYTPSVSTDAANKSYVDSVAAGLSIKNTCAAATTVALTTNVYNNGSSGVGATLTGASVGALTVDGYSPNIGDRLLIKNEVTSANNGIYVVTTVGSIAAVYVLTRSSDMNQPAEFTGAFTLIDNGTVNVDTGWVCTTSGTITVGTTAITFSQFSSATDGTVTSVQLAVPSWLSVSGGPITNSGTITLAANTSNALPAYSGVNLTSLAGANITANTVPVTALVNGSTTPSSSNFYRGDGTWQAVGGGSNPLTTLGDLLYGGTSGTQTRLAGNTAATDTVLISHGSGTAANAPTLSNSPAISGANITAATIPGASLVSASVTGTQIASSIALAGSPTTTTQTAGTSSTTIATTAFVNSAGIPIRTVQQQIFLSSGTYTPSTGMVFCLVETLAGGGGGGGTTSATSDNAGAGGGGGGCYASELFSASTIGSNQVVTVGSGGTGVAGANNGNTGGTTSLGSLISVGGGLGGVAQAFGTANALALGGAGGTIITGGTFIATGSPGNWGQRFANNFGIGGTGANSLWGGGGIVTWFSSSTNGASAGKNATGYGAGGGGSANYIGGASGSFAGGNGSSGAVIITEYCTQ